MRCPALSELPPPPPGKRGWPWTEGCPPLPDSMPNGRPWPIVSIITPSYNQGSFIEETIRSVLLQGYPNLEYVVVDGGSTDGSTGILCKYERWLSYWVSQPDKGQSDAINIGFREATGEICGWLNSDDVYEPGTLSLAAKYFINTPECSLLYGNGWYVDEQGKKTKPCHWIRPYDRRLFLTTNFILQPAALWRRSVWERTGGLDISYHWAMDWEWLLRATASVRPHYLQVDFARWRIRPDIKTMSGGWARRSEIAEISRKYGGVWQPTYMAYRLDWLVWKLTRNLGNGLLGQMAWCLLAPISWTMKMTVWRGRYLAEMDNKL